MKKIMILALSLVTFFMSTGNVFCGAEFDTGGFFPESRTEPAVIRSAAEMEMFIGEITEELVRSGDEQAQQFYAALKNEVTSFYAPYDEAFFARNNLIIAVLAQGSGSLRFSLCDLAAEDGVLKVRVRCFSPMIQTMDYRIHIMRLSVSKALYDAPRAEVIVEKAG